MKIHKVEVYIIDHDEVGIDDIKEIIENTKYPNRCIDPEVGKIETKDIGEWHGDHPLNLWATDTAKYFDELPESEE